jgi:hypothetical protein
MVFAHTKDVDSGFIGDPCRGDDLLEALMHALCADFSRSKIAERVNAEFHCVIPVTS